MSVAIAAGNIAVVLIEPDPAASAQSSLASLLARRLPAEGPILALGELASRHAPQYSGVERRPGGEERVERAAAAGPDPRGWRAIVLEAGAPAPAPEIAALREALAPGGRVLLLVPTRAPGFPSVVSDRVGALYEAGLLLTHEDEVALDEDRVLVLEARADEHVVRSYREGDETAIARLFAQSFSPDRGLDHWRWKYRDNPFGTLAISGAFSPGGELVAHYAAYPVPFRRTREGRPETVLCHQVGDTMTDRRFRHVGRGKTSLLARTARHFYARHCEGRVAFNYGFNTGNIQRFSQLFVGARKVWDIELWSCRAGDLRLAAPRRFRPYRAQRVDRLDSGFDHLFERVATRYGLLVERRRPYLEWRYLRRPDVEYRLYRVDRSGTLVGWGVARADGDRTVLGDALFDPEHPDAVSAMLRAATAADSDRAAGEHRVEGWFSRQPSWWSERLSALGFAAGPEPQGLGMVFVPFLECPDRELAGAYYLTMGDGDLF